MNSKNKNLLIGILIGASAGFVAGILMTNDKTAKINDLKSRISNLANDAQERISALRAMATGKEEKPEAAKPE